MPKKRRASRSQKSAAAAHTARPAAMGVPAAASRAPRVAAPGQARTAAAAGGRAVSGGGTISDADQVALLHTQGNLSDDGSGSDDDGDDGPLEDPAALSSSSDDDGDEEQDRSGDEIVALLSIDIDGAISATTTAGVAGAATATPRRPASSRR